MEQIAGSTLPPGMRLRLDGHVLSGEGGRQSDLLRLRARACCSSISCLAGQYESWIAPLAVILAVPLALLGTVGALTGLGVANNLYTQIGLILLIALVGQERDPDRRVRPRAAHARRRADRRGGRRGGAEPLPADPDDVLRLHPGRRAAGARDRAPAPRRASRSASPSSAACSPRPASRCCSCRPSSSCCSASRNGGRRGRRQREEKAAAARRGGRRRRLSGGRRSARRGGRARQQLGDLAALILGIAALDGVLDAGRDMVLQDLVLDPLSAARTARSWISTSMQ